MFTFPTKGELSCALGQFLAEAVEQSVQRRGRFTIAISGGSLPALLAPSCVGHPDMQWDRWEVRPLLHSSPMIGIALSLHRSSTPTNASYRPIMPTPVIDFATSCCGVEYRYLESRSTKSSCPPLLMPSDPNAVQDRCAPPLKSRLDIRLQPAQIADAYERELLDAFAGSLEKPPSFDLILLGLGADGHTACVRARSPG